MGDQVIVKLEGVPSGSLVIDLSVHWLYYIGCARLRGVMDTVVLSSFIAFLYHTFMVRCTVFLKDQAFGRRFMLFLSVKLIHHLLEGVVRFLKVRRVQQLGELFVDLRLLSLEVRRRKFG